MSITRRAWFTRQVRTLAIFFGNRRSALSEDMRKVGLTIIPVSIAGLCFANSTDKTAGSLILLGVGVVVWLYGVILKEVNSPKE